MKPEELVIGKVYFDIRYHRQDRNKPIIITFEYVSDDSASEEPGYTFRLIPGFWDGQTLQDEEELFFYRPWQLDDLIDLNKLIRTLEQLKERNE